MINFSQDHNVDRCTVGYTVGWDTTCHIGLTRNADPDYSCPGFTTSELQHIQDEKYYTPLGKFKQAILWCYGEANHAISSSVNKAFCEQLKTEKCPIVDRYTNMRYCKPSDANAIINDAIHNY